MITFENFREDVLVALDNKPSNWRDGQFVFNYIEEVYPGLARKVQFDRKVDCFYIDDVIEDFIRECYDELCKNVKS